MPFIRREGCMVNSMHSRNRKPAFMPLAFWIPKLKICHLKQSTLSISKLCLVRYSLVRQKESLMSWYTYIWWFFWEKRPQSEKGLIPKFLQIKSLFLRNTLSVHIRRLISLNVYTYWTRTSGSWSKLPSQPFWFISILVTHESFGLQVNDPGMIIKKVFYQCFMTNSNKSFCI